MAINKTILKKLNEKTVEEMEIRNFLTAVIQFESESRGWFEKDYIKILEENCKEESTK
jgi:hypothetical protein